ncbi:MAG: hypothetical protein ACOX1Q_08685 [Eubacteriales bacterium]|jgi:hypothetical protein
MADFKKPEDCLSVKTQSAVFSLAYGKIEYIEINAKKYSFISQTIVYGR